MSLKILHIFQSFEMGGAQKRCIEFCHYFPKDTHSILALNECYDGMESFDSQIVTPSIIKDFIYEKGKKWANIKRFRELFKTQQFDIVITQNWPTIEAVIANTPQIIPHIHQEDGFGQDEVKCLKWKRNLTRRLFLWGKTLIVPSMTLKNIAHKFWWMPQSIIHYIPNGILPKPIKENSIVDIKKDNHIILLSVVIFRKEKNIPLMLDMLAFFIHTLNLRILLILVGNGPLFSEVKAYAASIELTDQHVLFVGYQKDYSTLMAICDVFILTSDTEQQPLTILEAMAYAKPIIAPDVGDIKNMVCEENKKIIDRAHFKKPYDTLKAFLIQKENHILIGKQNQKKQESDFSFHESLERRYKIIQNLTSSK